MVTLQDAADLILSLPKSQQKLLHWQTAIDILIRAAEGGPAWLMLARIAMRRRLLLPILGERRRILVIGVERSIGASPLI
jgi:hypothetical protein